MLPYGVLLAGLLALVRGQDCQYKSTKGSDYEGSASKTVGGLECQAWGEQQPHQHTHGNLPGNLCRNPDNEPGVWCYTTDPTVRWQLCPVPFCSDIEEVFEEGIGTENITEDACGDKGFSLDIVQKASLALGCSCFNSARSLEPSCDSFDSRCELAGVSAVAKCSQEEEQTRVSCLIGEMTKGCINHSNLCKSLAKLESSLFVSHQINNPQEGFPQKCDYLKYSACYPEVERAKAHCPDLQCVWNVARITECEECACQIHPALCEVSGSFDWAMVVAPNTSVTTSNLKSVQINGINPVEVYVDKHEGMSLANSEGKYTVCEKKLYKPVDIVPLPDMVQNEPSCSTNWWDRNQKCICKPGERITKMKSYHNNYREDRRWTLECKAFKPKMDVRGDKWMFKTGQNNWDSPFEWDGVASNSFMVGMTSDHDNYREDRRFTVFYSSSPNWELNSCSGWTKRNEYDGKLDFSLSGYGVIAALKSVHNNGREDRIWWTKTCELRSLGDLCVKTDKAWDPKNDIPGELATTVPSIQACAKRCREVAQCRGFTLGKDGKCSLTRDINAKQVDVVGARSGPQICEGWEEIRTLTEANERFNLAEDTRQGLINELVARSSESHALLKTWLTEKGPKEKPSLVGFASLSQLLVEKSILKLADLNEQKLSYDNQRDTVISNLQRASMFSKGFLQSLGDVQLADFGYRYIKDSPLVTCRGVDFKSNNKHQFTRILVGKATKTDIYPLTFSYYDYEQAELKATTTDMNVVENGDGSISLQCDDSKLYMTWGNIELAGTWSAVGKILPPVCFETGPAERTKFKHSVGSIEPISIQLISIKWDSEKNVIPSNPDVVIGESVINKDHTQSVQSTLYVSDTWTKSDTTTWTHTWGFGLSTSFKTSASFSFLGLTTGAEFTIGAEISYGGSYSTTTTDTKSKTVSSSIEVECPPRTLCKLKLVSNKLENQEIGFTATVRKTQDGGGWADPWEEKGTWTGVTKFDFITEFCTEMVDAPFTENCRDTGTG